MKDRAANSVAKLCWVLGVMAIAFLVTGAARAEDDLWSDLKVDLFGDRPINEADEWLALEAPYRAHDAAMVPIDIVALQPQSPERFIRTITLVENSD